MNCIIRKWKIADASSLARSVSNKKVLNNLRDGLPYPYTEADGKEFITAMLGSEFGEYAFAIEYCEKVVGSISVTRQGNIHSRTGELGLLCCRRVLGQRNSNSRG